MNTCTTYSSELPQCVNFRILRHYNKRYILRMKYASDDIYQDWTLILSASLIATMGTNDILNLSLGDGLEIDTDDHTNLIIQFWGPDNDKTLPVGIYPYEMLVAFTADVSRYLTKGALNVVNTIN